MLKEFSQSRASLVAATVFVSALTFALPSAADTLQDIKQKGEITMCEGLDNLRPYLYKNADGSYAGFEFEMMQYALKKLGISKFKYLSVEWAALIPGLKSKRCDIIWSGMSITEQRRIEGGIEYTRPYFWESDHIIVLEDSPIQTLDDLKGKTLSAMAQSVEETQGKALIAKGYGADMKNFTANQTSFLALENKQVDAVIDDVFSFQAQKQVTPNIRMLNGVALIEAVDPKWQAAQDKAPYVMGGIGIGVRKEDTALLAALNQMLNDMDADGTRKAILTKYGAWDDTQLMSHMMRQ